ncbi:MAG: hypothetical protein ACTTKY_00180 [Catonella sp.]
MIEINADFTKEAIVYGYYELEVDENMWNDMTEEEKIIYINTYGVPHVSDLTELNEEIDNIEIVEGSEF